MSTHLLSNIVTTLSETPGMYDDAIKSLNSFGPPKEIKTLDDVIGTVKELTTTFRFEAVKPRRAVPNLVTSFNKAKFYSGLGGEDFI